MNQKQKEYVRQSIEVLSQTLGLKPEVKEMSDQERIPISCVLPYVGGVINSLNNVPVYEKIVRKFEKKYDVHVYYCIPGGGGFVTMLYVGSDEREWESMKPRLGEKIMFAAVYNSTYDFFDFGDVVLDARDGVLIRIG